MVSKNPPTHQCTIYRKDVLTGFHLEHPGAEPATADSRVQDSREGFEWAEHACNQLLVCSPDLCLAV